MTIQEWNKLSREEKRQAILNFEEPDNIYEPIKIINLKGEKL